MTTISIDASSRDLDEATPRWAADQINTANADGATPCIKVSVNEPGVAEIRLATAGCRSSGGGGIARFNDLERSIIDAFRERVTAQDPIRSGHLISFVQELRRLLGSKERAAA